MDREQLIECIANAIEQGPGRTLPPYRKMADHVLDAITAAGMVVVPGADLRAMIADSENGEWRNVADDLRAMTEAANAE